MRLHTLLCRATDWLSPRFSELFLIFLVCFPYSPKDGRFAFLFPNKISIKGMYIATLQSHSDFTLLVPFIGLLDKETPDTIKRLPMHQVLLATWMAREKGKINTGNTFVYTKTVIYCTSQFYSPPPNFIYYNYE